MLPKDPWQGAQGAYICIWLLPKRSPSHLRLTYIKGNCTPTNHVFSFIFVTIIVRREGRSSSMKIERCHIVAVYSGTNRQVGDTWHKLAHLTIEEVHLAQLRCNPSVNPAGRSFALHRDLTHTQRGPLRGTLALCALLCLSSTFHLALLPSAEVRVQKQGFHQNDASRARETFKISQKLPMLFQITNNIVRRQFECKLWSERVKMTAINSQKWAFAYKQ